MKQRILLLSTVHPPADPRIRNKIAGALSATYEVHCALPGFRPKPNENFTGISLPYFRQLAFRLLLTHPIALLKCLPLRPKIVHIFVPELIPLALIFQFAGAKVIYEVQENLYKKFAIKQYNNNLLFWLCFKFFDRVARRRFRLIFTENAYLEEYQQLAYPAAVIRNFPQSASLVRVPAANAFSNPPVFIYVGVISIERCLDVMLLAFAKFKATYPDFHVHFYGSLRVSEKALRLLPGYAAIADQISFHGYTDHQTAFQHAGEAVAGIALLRPVADYPQSYTTKMFEYMSLGLPVITSGFPLYREVVEKHGCGFCIDPENADLLCEKLCWLTSNRQQAALMGLKGKIAVAEHYNWDRESQNLLNFYSQLL